jgi:Xaa-Pro aminopeptidase
MEEAGVDLYLIPSEDFHHSEYVNDYFKFREYMSGFTGDAGTLLVGADDAWLWTDGRFFLQGAQQLEGSGIQLMKSGEDGVPTLEEFLARQSQEHRTASDKASQTAPVRDSAGSHAGRLTLGFDGRLITAHQEEEFAKLDLDIRQDLDLASAVWKSRPPLLPGDIYDLPGYTTGRSTEEKLTDIRRIMEEKGADYIFVSDLTETAWLLNKRGSDIDCTPVFFAYTIIGRKDVQVFTLAPLTAEGESRSAAGGAGDGVKRRGAVGTNDGSDIPPIINQAPQAEGFVCRGYEEINGALAELPAGSTILMDGDTAGSTFFHAVPESVKILDEASPLCLLKAQKNDTELACTREAHIRDGVAMVEFLSWLKQRIAGIAADDGASPLTEIEAADYLLKCRQSQPGFLDISFPTISAYGPHGAIVHYEPTEESNATVLPKGFLLVDSGAQYIKGTTDITRTVSMGPLTAKEKEYYTLVLKSHIRLMTTVFAPGTKGIELDRITRELLQEHDLNYNHGTGHGVGHVLSVHEDPNNISFRAGEHPIMPRMITTDEPGVYIAGEFGVRIENEMICYERKDGQLGHENITFCPYEREAILTDILTEEERRWIDAYHADVLQTLSPLLTEDATGWLSAACRPL